MSLEQIRESMRAALKEAMLASDPVAVSALRSGMAALDNAQAVPVPETGAGAIEAASLGAGSSDVPRRELTDLQVAEVVAAEVDQRYTEAAGYDRLGHPERAEVLRAQAAVLERWSEAPSME